MKIQFIGGILDGHEEKVSQDSGWDSIRVAGVANSAGQIIEQYKWDTTSLETVGSDDNTAIVGTVRFVRAEGLTIGPGETARVLKLALEI